MIVQVDRVSVHVPATSANLGPGFDALGIALDLEDVYTFAVVREKAQCRVVYTEGMPPNVSSSKDNLAVKAFHAVYREAGYDGPPLEVLVKSCIPVSRGLGSSAAAIVAGVLAANAHLGNRFTVSEAITLATRIEGHPDNVTPCILGGFTVSSMVGPRTKYLGLTVPEGIMAVVAIPNFEVTSTLARNVLPVEIPFRDAVFNVGRATMLVASLVSGSFSNLRYAMEDRLHQPYRSVLVPGLPSAIRAAMDAGCLGAAMSGSGPSIIAFADSRPGSSVDPRDIGEAMKAALAQAEVEAEYKILAIRQAGAVIRLE